MKEIQQKSVSAIRALSIDAIQKAKSGHPGLPLGAASIGYELYARHLKHNPQNPNFFNRDRFVLSAGHGTMLLYPLLHLFGYDLSMDEIKNFRQLGSKTPGHPEYGVTPGVDCSTGPLGQGIANAVGFAVAETMLAARFNRPGFNVVDHYTFAMCGEGCLMEGIANEAASIAGTWNLGKLILLYDCNKITIEGSSDIAFDEDIAARHAAQGWQVLRVADGNDLWEIGEAITAAKLETAKPSLIIINTKIGFGSPREDSSAAHGAPLGDEGVAATKKKIGWNYPPFTVPQEVYDECGKLAQNGVNAEKEWNKMMKEYAKKYPDLYKDFLEATKPLPSIDFEQLYKAVEGQNLSTRKASHIILNKIADLCPSFVGGSADLGPSNLSLLENNKGDYSKDNRYGRNIHFGIREHAMGAIVNGMSLHGGVIPYCATFFSFSDYMKNAVRMSAIMEIPAIYVFTHDSIGVGEDGPTHQPIEHLSGLRAMPVLKVFRPADGVETAAAYQSALSEKRPAAIIASRQDLPALATTGKGALKGGYIVYDAKNPRAVIIATGSEVSISIDAAKILAAENIPVRVVSMPCMSLFEQQSAEYKESVIPKNLRARVAVEAAASQPWGRYVGLDGEYVCIDRFGESSKPEELFKRYGITAEEIVRKVKRVLK